MNKANGKKLSDFYKVNRRYSRSINLERDYSSPHAVYGYIVNSKSVDMLNKFIASFLNGGYRAWTITGVYGTGKSAFAHLLASLCAGKQSEMKKNALKVLSSELTKQNSLYKQYNSKFPSKGLVRVIATSQNEAISNTIIRALNHGVSDFWDTRKPNLYKCIVREYKKIGKDHHYVVPAKLALELLIRTAKASKTGVLLIIDELGKNLEYAVNSKNFDDLYLLQQIAELPTRQGVPGVYFIGILHQSFSDYLGNAAQDKRNEWAKIQGRFEDVVFTDTFEQEIKVIGKVFSKSGLPKEFGRQIATYGDDWKAVLNKNKTFLKISRELISSVYPLHPVAAVILPFLCHKHAQNDRTLFTFLTSNEPFSLNSFVNNTVLDSELHTLKLCDIYDYFVETALGTISLRPDFQRWSEIRERVSDARNLDEASLKVLKTIGILNLVFTSGDLRASRELVILSLCDDPNNREQKSFWEKVVDKLVKENIVLWRLQADELRLWQGSDFDIESFLEEYKSKTKGSLAELLKNNYALKDLVAQRHSYEKGTLRYFSQAFFDDIDKINEFLKNDIASDGLIIYWLGSSKFREFLPLETKTGKPIISIMPKDINALSAMCREYVAIKSLRKGVSQLSHDGVARKEVNQRLHIAKTFLDREVDVLIDFGNMENIAHIVGISECGEVANRKSFNNVLSKVLDKHYSKSIILRNELINKSKVTAQISKAKKILVNALLNNTSCVEFGIKGHGPERTILESLFIKTRILQYDDNKKNWVWNSPDKRSGLSNAWKAINNFLDKAKGKRELTELFSMLENPPFGIKQPLIPLLLLGVLLSRDDQIGIFKDGTFLHKLTVDDVELFEKKTSSYSFKSFSLEGVKVEAYKELEKIFYTPQSRRGKKTLIGLTKVFISFVRSLPQFTLNTKDLLPRTLAVRKVLLEAIDPDALLFSDLPKACGLRLNDDSDNKKNVKKLRERLETALVEMRKKYDLMLHESLQKIKDTFGIPDSSDLYHNLRERAMPLRGVCIERKLKSFIFAATDESVDENTWLKGLLMIAVDKPSELWDDEDVHRLDFYLNDLARRFKQFEKMREKIENSKDSNTMAVNVILSGSEAGEISEIYWTDKNVKDKAGIFASELFKSEEFKDREFRSAFLALLVEKMADLDREKVSEKKD